MTRKTNKGAQKKTVSADTGSHVEDQINLLASTCCSGNSVGIETSSAVENAVAAAAGSCCSNSASGPSGSQAGGCCFGPGEADENGEVDPGYLDEKRRYLARIRRIEGQVRGIHRMVDEEQYCIDVLTQISAVNSALRSLALGLLDAHLHHCVLHAANSGPDELDAKLAEASAAIARLAK